MVNIADIQKDFRALAKFTKTASFAYSDIHNDTIATISGYDYQQIIDETARVKGISKQEATDLLVELTVLKYIPDGTFSVNVGESTRGGGGVNIGGEILFSYDNSTPQTIYHEYAHSLQNIKDVFDDKTIEKMYKDVWLNKKKQNPHAVNDYEKYLNEMHAEAFAYAVLLLRAKNFYDFEKHSLNAIKYGISMILKGQKEQKTRYDDGQAASKYYASYNVMKKTIQTILSIRNQKKQNKFFDENGVVKYRLVSKLAKKIVMQSAYSPAQFEAFKRHMPKINFTKRGLYPVDHSFFKDIIKAQALKGIIIATEKVKSMVKKPIQEKVSKTHHKLIMKQFLNNHKKFHEPIDYSLPEHLVALQSIKRIHTGISMIDHKTFMKYFSEDLLRAIVAKRHKNKDFSAQSRQEDAQVIIDYIGIKKPENVAVVEEFLEKTDEILQKNINNKYFDKIMTYSEHSFYQQRMAMETLEYNPQNLMQAPKVATNIPYMLNQDAKKTKLALQAGVNINSQCEDGETALMIAENKEIVEILLNANPKPDLEIKDNDGYTALMYNDNAIKTKMLLEVGANVDAQNNYGTTALMLAKDKEIIAELLKAKPNLELKNNKGYTALSYCQTPEKVKMLLEAGANVDAQNNHGATALMLAKDKEVFKELLKAKPNLELQDNNGFTALLYHQTPERTKMLLEAGANPNTKTNRGNSALMYTIQSTDISIEDKLKIMKTLIDYGAKTEQKNTDGYTTLTYTASIGWIDSKDKEKIIESLIVNGADVKYALNNLSGDAKDLVQKVCDDMKKKSEKLAKTRNKIALKIDKIDTKLGSPIEKVFGKKASEIKLPKAITDTESKISYHIYKNSTPQNG